MVTTVNTTPWLPLWQSIKHHGYHSQYNSMITSQYNTMVTGQCKHHGYHSQSSHGYDRQTVYYCALTFCCEDHIKDREGVPVIGGLCCTICTADIVPGRCTSRKFSAMLTRETRTEWIFTLRTAPVHPILNDVVKHFRHMISGWRLLCTWCNDYPTGNYYCNLPQQYVTVLNSSDYGVLCWVTGHTCQRCWWQSSVTGTEIIHSVRTYHDTPWEHPIRLYNS